MSLIHTQVQVRSAEAATNAAAMQAAVDDLRLQIQSVANGGGEAARAKHVGRGKLLPRDRVQMLLDPGTPFLELSPLAAYAMYNGDAPGAGVITGIGRVSGVDCLIVCNDATVKGGTYYPMTVKSMCVRKKSHNKIICHVFIWWTRAVPTCPTKTMCFQTATTLGASFTTKPI